MSQTLREFYDAVVSFQSKALSDAASYNQVNVLAGYAAIFAIWSAVSSSLPKWMVLTSGGLMTVSVIVYVSWTIANMIFLKTHHEAMAAAVTQGVEGFVDRVVEAEKRSLTRRDRIMKWWLPVVVAAGGTALVAAVMLAGAAFASVVGSPLTSRTPRDISNATDPESLGWRVKLLEQRSGDLGAFAISWPNESTKSGFVVANGMPMQVGVSDLRPKQLGYQPEGWIGNLTTVVIGNCQVQISLTRGGDREFSTIPLPGYFSPGETLDFSVQVPAKLRSAEQITLSRVRCADAFYIDKDRPSKRPSPIKTPRPPG